MLFTIYTLFALRYSQIIHTIVDRTHYEKAESRKQSIHTMEKRKYFKDALSDIHAVRCSLFADHTHN